MVRDIDEGIEGLRNGFGEGLEGRRYARRVLEKKSPYLASAP